MLLGDAITAVRTEGGFDSSSTNSAPAVIRSWVWQAVTEALAESKWRKRSLELGPTVAGQAQYVIPDEVLEVQSLRVGGGRPWASAPGIEALWEAQGGNGWVRGAPGAFLGTYEPDADSVLELWPAPTEDGLSIESICAVMPTESVDDGAVLPLPQDVVRPIAVNGAVAIGLRLIEQRHGDAQQHQALADAAAAKLKKRANTRVGAGPIQIPIRQP